MPSDNKLAQYVRRARDELGDPSTFVRFDRRAATGKTRAKVHAKFIARRAEVLTDPHNTAARNDMNAMRRIINSPPWTIGVDRGGYNRILGTGASFTEALERAKYMKEKLS